MTPEEPVDLAQEALTYAFGASHSKGFADGYRAGAASALDVICDLKIYDMATGLHSMMRCIERSKAVDAIQALIPVDQTKSPSVEGRASNEEGGL